jgi:tRNA(Ile2) C34 agmatinyltransferase TiaS
MERPKIEDTRPSTIRQSVAGKSVNVYEYSKLQDEYIDYLEGLVKKCDLADVVKSCEHDYQSYCQGFQFKCSKCGDTYGAC